MASVTFKRTNNIDSVPITDGQLIFDTSDQKIYLDNGNTREVYGGGSGTDLISNVSDATDNNAFNANATVSLFTRKSSIVDTKAEIQSVTQAGVPLGCKGFNEVIGTGDISALGDGSVTGAILANKSAIDTVNQNLTCRYNRTTDMVQLYDGTEWFDWKRAYRNAYKLYDEGDSKPYANGTYSYMSTFALDGGYTVYDDHLECDVISVNAHCRSLSFTERLDLTPYTKVIANTNYGDVVADISGLSQYGYVTLMTYNYGGTNNFILLISSALDNELYTHMISNGSMNNVGTLIVNSVRLE